MKRLPKRHAAAAYAYNAAQQYKESTGTHLALMELASELAAGEHLLAFNSGEFEDIDIVAWVRDQERFARSAK